MREMNTVRFEFIDENGGGPVQLTNSTMSTILW